MIETLDAAVTTVALALTVVLALAIAGAAFRMIVGPGYADRFVALDMLTGIAVAACALTAVVTGRREFLDVGLGLALIAFVATIAFAAFLEKKERETS
ncbi:monovalent cation/H+ antiporter complex subunit F [Salinarimonas sp.]|uniref:monovalent cation/H+ antiporter complex subunit F n=1 Tax=Salinarimonas sp. TaxID=2766526 RepID=UPI0032D9A250